MANPTNPFNWQMPTSTDLVTDLPADFEVFGQAVATSMADLLGGTTGQVLSKASNTDMDFTWTSANPGDITAVTAGTGITGGGTSGAVTVSFDQANFGGGQFAAGKNKIINGDFNVWQRGTSISATNTYAYISDRWQSVCDGAITGARTAFTPGTAPVAGYEGKFFLKYTKTSGTYWQVQQYIEDVQTLAGQTATISFWAKVDAAKTVYIQLSQNFGSGGSSTVTTSVGTQALTTSWARYSFTVSVPSISGKTVGTSSNLALEIGIAATTGNVVFDLWGVQVEAGSTATPFQTATGTIQGELAACQRYYARQSASGNQYTPYGIGYGSSGTTNALVTIKLPVTMRVNPTAIDYSAITFQDTGGLHTASSVTINQGGFDHVQVAIVSTGLTQNVPGALLANASTSSYLGFSAEL
jgi:hypothetical protein